MSYKQSEASKEFIENLQCSLLACGLPAYSEDTDIPTILTLAREKIDVFPFHKVEQKWLQLFTDLNIMRAHKQLSNLPSIPWTSEQVIRGDEHITEVISCLDDALIVAGGKGRQDIVQAMFCFLHAAMMEREVGSHINERPAKRRRKDAKPELESLPDEQSFIKPSITNPFEALSKPSIETFQQHIRRREHPVKLIDILSEWPALQKWSKVKFWRDATLGGRRLVPVEIGQNYNDEDWRQEIMPFGRFLDKYIINGDKSEKVGYLAQHDLISQIPQLRSDILVPDYCYCDIPLAKNDRYTAKGHDSIDSVTTTASAVDDEHDIKQNVWFGGRTVSPLHHDPYHNILCQVHGTKYVRLYSPEHSSQLYPRSMTEAAPHAKDSEESSATIDMSNNSNVDIFAMECSPHEDWDETWPGISEVPYIECLLGPGEALYIPKGWWHYIRSISATGISVSFWW